MNNAGYSAMLIDLHGYGEAGGEYTTFGYRESDNARAAVAYLYQQKKCFRVIAIGRSLGGAASLLGQQALAVDGYTLESVYPNVEQAVENRLTMRVGGIGAWLAPLLYQQIPLRTGIRLAALQPIEAIKKIKAPVLILHGSLDKHTTLAEAKALFEQAPEPKTFYSFQGAAHVDLYHYDRRQYEKIVLKFLKNID